VEEGDPSSQSKSWMGQIGLAQIDLGQAGGAGGLLGGSC
jgi:hypothetical protein